MKLGDKAQESPDVTLAGSLMSSHFEMLDDDPDLTPADDLSPEGEFPQYGDFMLVREYSPVDGMDRGKTHIEVTQALAEWLVERDLGEGDRFRVRESQKVDGRWKFELETVE